MKRFSALLLVVFALCTTAGAQTAVQKATADFGLMGNWAYNCSVAAGVNGNARTTIYAKGDVVIQHIEFGAGRQPNEYRWIAAERIDATHLRVTAVIEDETLELIIRKFDDGRVQTFSSVTSSGKVLIKDGFFPGGGQAPIRERCQ
ncbi:MAG TPA: hypothetical protein VKF63_00640 [Terracidiphilus sp.]|nr:hypothetical protein [Terracidiphilus sp.]